MKQSRLMSLVEAVANVIVGYGVAVVTQILIFPIFRDSGTSTRDPFFLFFFSPATQILQMC